MRKLSELSKEDIKFIKARFDVIPSSTLTIKSKSLRDVFYKTVQVFDVKALDSFNYAIKATTLGLDEIIDNVKELRKRHQNASCKKITARNIPPVLMLLGAIALIITLVQRKVYDDVLTFGSVPFLGNNSAPNNDTYSPPTVDMPSENSSEASNHPRNFMDSNSADFLVKQGGHDPVVWTRGTGVDLWTIFYLVSSIFLTFACFYGFNTRIKRYAKPEVGAVNKLVNLLNLLIKDDSMKIKMLLEKKATLHVDYEAKLDEIECAAKELRRVFRDYKKTGEDAAETAEATAEAISDNTMETFSFKSSTVVGSSRTSLPPSSSLIDFEEAKSVIKNNSSFDWNANFVGAGNTVELKPISKQKKKLEGLIKEEEKPTLTAREFCELAKNFLGISSALMPNKVFDI